MQILDFHEPISAITHGLWAILAIPAWYFLIKNAKQGGLWTLHLFMFTLVLCYSASFLFHSINGNLRREFLLIDQLCIFLFIGGTYTAIIQYCCRYPLLKIAISWMIIILSMFYFTKYYRDEVVHLIIAWTLMFLSYELLLTIFTRDKFLIMLGGLIYTIAAILEFFHKPTIIEGFMNHHEVFHMLIMVATVCHYAFIFGVSHGRSAVYYKIQPKRQRA